MIQFAKRQLSGWGGYRPILCKVADPASREELRTLISPASGNGPLLARGMGRSYGDSAVVADGTVLLQSQADRILSFDRSTGLVRCEAGVTLADLIELCLPSGWFLPTTPGTKFVTIGGAIAADVHGKNHHVDGTFGQWVRSFTLLTADGAAVPCSADSNSDIFWATIGGMGLTGHILEAEIQLRRCPSAYYRVKYLRCRDLAATLAAMNETDSRYQYSVGWIDCLATQSRLGRSVLMLGNDAAPADLPPHQAECPYEVRRKRTKSVPIYFPNFALNSLSVSLFNRAYYAAHPDRECIVDYDTYFYPLDGIHHWNRIYGRRGFIQYQALFPDSTAERGLQEVLETLGRFGLASFLAVIKKSGPANPSPLSYLYSGYTLALDIPNVPNSMLEMTRKLDEILLRCGGRLYLAKDSLMDERLFAAMYPRKEEFLALKRRIDPNNRFTSSQAKRVGLVVT